MIKMLKRVLVVCVGVVSLLLPLTGAFSQAAEANSPHRIIVAVFADSEPHPPYGILSIRVYAEKVVADGNPHYDWYFYDVRVVTEPGVQRYASAWFTCHTWADHVVDFRPLPPPHLMTRWLSDHDPTTTVGGATATVTLGGGGASASWSYTIPDVVVIDRSSYLHHWAKWEHQINEHALVGSSTYRARPGFVVRTREGSWSIVSARYEAR
jgi:hypothetical protein